MPRRRNYTEQQARSIRILAEQWGCTAAYLAEISGLTVQQVEQICQDTAG